jgi:hypothetical protein
MGQGQNKKRMVLPVLFSALFGLAGTVAQARASIAVLLEEPYGKLGLVDPSGHSAVYFDNICAASPTELRLCQPGELGVVVSRYDNVGGYDWLAMPLLPYLYSVERVEDIPQTIDREGEIRIRDAYRRTHLESIAPDMPDGSAPESNWYELVGSALDRTIYGFSVKTTPEDDAKVVAVFNDRKNKQRYNGMFVNCADFVRTTINMVYPHAIRRNFIADLGMTSPKSAARGLAHYAAKHPDTEFKTFMVPQVKGNLPRSGKAVVLAEGIVKRYSVPLVILSPATVGVVLAAYLTQGRFAMPKDAPELELHDAPKLTMEAGKTKKPVLGSSAEDANGGAAAGDSVAVR